MKTRMKAAITAIGGYVPEYVLTNAELADMVDTNDENTPKRVDEAL